jgi:hypothetical protein
MNLPRLIAAGLSNAVVIFVVFIVLCPVLLPLIVHGIVGALELLGSVGQP